MSRRKTKSFCQSCGKETPSARSKFCSRKCNPDLEETCLVCKTILVDKEKKKFCSRSCSVAYNNAATPKRKPEGACRDCGVAISTQYARCVSCRENPAKKPKQKRVKKKRKEKKVFLCNVCSVSVSYGAKTCQKHVPRKPQNTCIACGKFIKRTAKSCVDCRDAVACKYFVRSPLLQEGVDLRRVAPWLAGEVSYVGKSLPRTIKKYLLYINDFKCSQCGFDTPHPVDGKTILEVDHIDGDAMNNEYNNLRVLCPNCHALTPSYRGRNTGKSTRAFHYLRVKRGDPRLDTLELPVLDSEV